MRKKILSIIVVAFVGYASVMLVQSFNTNSKDTVQTQTVFEVDSVKKLDYSECHITVKGMVCSSCSNKIETALNHTEGVKSITIDRQKDKVYITYDASQIKVKEFESIIAALGYNVVRSELKTGKENLKVIDYQIRTKVQ